MLSCKWTFKTGHLLFSSSIDIYSKIFHRCLMKISWRLNQQVNVNFSDKFARFATVSQFLCALQNQSAFSPILIVLKYGVKKSKMWIFRNFCQSIILVLTFFHFFFNIVKWQHSRLLYSTPKVLFCKFFISLYLFHFIYNLRMYFRIVWKSLVYFILVKNTKFCYKNFCNTKKLLSKTNFTVTQLH